MLVTVADDLPDVDAGALDALRARRACRKASRSCRSKGRRLQEIVGPWFGVLFWAIGSFSLFASAMGIADYTSRLAADILKSTYLRSSPVSESRLYFWLVWGLVALGSLILLIGMDQPLVLLVISATVGGTMMCLYSFLLLVLNRRGLPDAIKVRSYRVGALIWSTGFFGLLAGADVLAAAEAPAGVSVAARFSRIAVRKPANCQPRAASRYFAIGTISGRSLLQMVYSMLQTLFSASPDEQVLAAVAQRVAGLRPAVHRIGSGLVRERAVAPHVFRGPSRDRLRPERRGRRRTSGFPPGRAPSARWGASARSRRDGTRRPWRRPSR